MVAQPALSQIVINREAGLILDACSIMGPAPCIWCHTYRLDCNVEVDQVYTILGNLGTLLGAIRHLPFLPYVREMWIQVAKNSMHGSCVQVGTHKYMYPSHDGPLTYCCIEALDHEGEDLLAKLKERDVHTFISNARKEGGILLVHCYVSNLQIASESLSIH